MDQNALVWANKYLDWNSGKSSNLAYVYENVRLGNDVPVEMLVGPLFDDGGPAPGDDPAPVPEPSQWA